MQKNKDEEKTKVKKPRRGRNEGMIRFIEAKKLYEGRYAIGIDEDGGTIYKSIYGKKKSDVITKMRNALTALGKGTYVDPTDKTLITWCKEWYEVYKEPKIRSNTKDKYQVSMTRIRKYDIANMPLKNLSLEIIQKFYNQLSREGKAEETIRATHSLINGALERAEGANMIVKNPAKHVIIPKTDDDTEEKEAKALTDKQCEAFLFQLGRRSKYFMYALFMLNTGLRPGEALALTRADIDIKKKTVKVNKTYLERAKKIQNSPKTASSKRTVPIPSDIIKLLIEYMLQQPKKDSNDPLFQTETGNRPSQSYLRKRFKYAADKTNFKWVNLHTMRHTYASKLFKEKIEVKVISQLLGHKDVSTTYDIYVHFIDNVVEESVQVLNAGLPETLPGKSRKGEKKNMKNSNVIDLKKASTT